MTEDEITAYIDSRLPPERAAAVERALAADPALAARVAADRAAREALRLRIAAAADRPIPPRLRVAAIRAGLRARRLARLRAAAAGLVLLAAGAAGGWTLRPVLAPDGAGGAGTLTAAIDAHRVFVVEKLHPVEVAAAQEQHLVQWLSRRVGQRLTVPDLTGLGFALMGGRVLPAGAEAAAQFMYQRNDGVRLTLYVRAGHGGSPEFRFASQGDIGAFAWADEGLVFAMVGAVDRQTLLALCDAAYRQLDPAGSPPKVRM